MLENLPGAHDILVTNVAQCNQVYFNICVFCCRMCSQAGKNHWCQPGHMHAFKLLLHPYAMANAYMTLPMLLLQ